MTSQISRDIRQIKLVNGDELLTEVLGEDRDEFLIRNPLKVHKKEFVVGGVPREANLFTTWMSFADMDEIIIPRQHIIAEALVNDAVAIHYVSMMENNQDDMELRIGKASEAKHPELIRRDIDGIDEEPEVESIFIDPEEGKKRTFH
jgi:hypothetical protein